MKRFIITNLLAITVIPILACGWFDTHNYYLFNVYDQTDFKDRVETICDNNWKIYLGMNDDEWFSFSSKKEDIINAARQKGDALMVSYVQNLDKYLDCSRDVSSEVWDYPTEQTEDTSALAARLALYAL